MGPNSSISIYALKSKVNALHIDKLAACVYEENTSFISLVEAYPFVTMITDKEKLVIAD